MAQQILNSGSSVVDFLKSQNKASDFNSRKSLYETSGLKERLGDYTGSAAQNVAFLKQLQTSTGPTIPETPATNAITTAGSNVSTEPLATTPTSVTEPVSTTPGAGMGAYDALSAIGYDIPSSEDITNKALESSAFKTFQEGQEIKNLGIQSKAAEDKVTLESKAAQDTEKTIQSFGQRGLFFSGMRQEAVNDIVDALAASKLGVDREVAQKLLEQGQATKEEFIKIASDIASEAVKGNDRAIDQLNKVGLALVGGKLVPTLEAQRAQDTAEKNAAQQELNQAKFDLSVAKTASQIEDASARLEIAQSRLDLSKANLELNQTKFELAKTGKDRLLTLSEQQAYGLPGGARLSDAVGLKPLSPATRTTLNNVTSALPLVDTLETLSNGLGLADSTAGTVVTGTKLKTEAILPSTKAGQYESQKNAFLSLITRALGEKGTLALQDVERITNALPGFYDTKSSATTKLTTLKNIMQDVYDRSLSGYYDSSSGTTTSSGKTPTSGTTKSGIKYTVQ